LGGWALKVDALLFRETTENVQSIFLGNPNPPIVHSGEKDPPRGVFEDYWNLNPSLEG
jgi:hypothetical protein